MDPISKRLFIQPDTTINNPIILVYHGTPDKFISDHHEVHSDNFKRQLDFLKLNEWKTINISELKNNQTFSSKTIIITFDDGYNNNYKGAFQPLIERDMCASWFIVSNTIGKISTWFADDTKQQPMLNSEQLSEMTHKGMEIGSHGNSHTRLNQLTPNEIHSELIESKNTISKIINKEVTSFAYPYGEFNEKTIDMIKKAGYKIACSTRSGKNNMTNDIFKLRRITMTANDSLSSFARKIALADNDVGVLNTSRYILSRITKRI